MLYFKCFVEEMEGKGGGGEEGRTERRKGGSREGVWRSTGVVSIYDKNRFLIFMADIT